MDYTNEFFRMVFTQNLTHSFMEMSMLFSIHNGMGIKRKVTLLNLDGKFWHIPIGGLKFSYMGDDSFKVSIFDSDGQHVPINMPADGAVRPGYAGMLDSLDFLSEGIYCNTIILLVLFSSQCVNF
ncbi:hypothetical protein ACFE04_020022 [Oxalis oulophora]